MSDETPAWLPERVAAAEHEVGGTFDLTACVREPIHLLGGIQSYGALVALSADRITVVSENAEALLGVPDLAGAPGSGLLKPDQLAELSAAETVLLPVDLPAGRFDVTAHRSGDGTLILEFEPAGPRQEVYTPVRQALMRLQKATTVIEACRAAVTEIRAITGYDRVVAYRFESEDGPGEVIAEDVAEDREAWLGLWFPATDIPPQARRLYERNWIRVIADVDDATVRLTPAGEPLDLSMSVLRTVSEFHLEYLRNIGVASSMSVSLLSGGRLWGLIACHGSRPTVLSPQVRAASEFFGVALSLHLAALGERDETAAREQSRATIARMLEDFAARPETSWSADPAALTSVIGCDAVIVRDGAEVLAHGAEPGLLDLLPAPEPGEIWHSDRLAEDVPGWSGPYAGALILPSGPGGDRIVWLRAERTVGRRWATDPSEPVSLGPHGRRLTPRGSTAVFLASVRGRSVPWSPTDHAMAVELGRAVLGIAVAHARRVSALNTELSRSNVDLDSFAHAAAHDLKEPLRGIANTATFIAEDAAEGMDPVTARRLESIQRLAARMETLLNALLYYSRIGRADLHRTSVDLRAAVDRALEVAGPRLREAQVAVTLPEPGVSVRVDPVLFDQVLVNLLVNAAKYAHPDRPRTVEVGLADAAVFVRDNGIGMPEHLREQAFQLFRRLHPAAGSDGSGAGLAIVRRIVERHGGQAWAAESPGGGTTVWTTFPDTGRDLQ